MKTSKIVIPIILVVLLGLAWFNFLTETGKNITAYSDYIEAAEESLEKGLYEQAIEYFKDSLKYNNSKNTYHRIKDTYDLLYQEENTAFIRNCYIEDMEEAVKEYPKDAEFWFAIANLHMDTNNYTSAYKTVERALNYGASSKELDELYKELLYMVKLDYKLYYDFKTALNGYISVFDGSRWMVLDGKGNPITSYYYELIGLINDEGKGFYVNEIDTRFLDHKQVPRARFDVDIEDAGYYSERSGYAPVKIDGKWRYVNLAGEFLDGEYEYAGSFYHHKAAVKQDGKWFIIDDNGNKVSQKTYEDIKLDLYGSYIQCGIVIAKENDKYHLYDTDFNKIGDFECDDIDICIDDNLIAFEKDGKWGFVDKKGKVVVEPRFAKAKSFSNKMAAVCNEDGLWGYINRNYELVINYEFLDAFYFNSDETSIVSTGENTYQLLHFMFD